MIAAGAVIATGGVAALAAGAAVAAGLGAAAISGGIGKVDYQSHVDEYNRQGAAGTLVLAVPAETQARAGEITRIMHENGATKTELVAQAGEDLRVGIDASF